MVLAQWSRWLDGGRGTSDNMHVKELVVTTQALRGAISPQWKAHSSTGRDFPKALIRKWTLDSLERYADPQEQEHLPQQKEKWSLY